MNRERVVINLSNVASKVGGMQHILVLIFGFFFKPYTLFSFRADAINTFFTVKSSDKSLVTDQKKLKLSFCNKARVILGFPNKRVKRLLETYHLGHNFILKELDMVRIIKDI